MNLYTNYDEFSSEFPEVEYLHYKVSETGQTPYYIGVSRFILRNKPLLANFFDSFPEFSVQFSEEIRPWEILSITSFKNLSKNIRQIVVECLSEDSINIFKNIELDNGIQPFTINNEENKVTFCLKPLVPVSCNSSSLARAELPDFPLIHDMIVKINGVEYNGSDLSIGGSDIIQDLPPVLFMHDYGVMIYNTGSDCLLIEFPFNKQEHIIPELPFGLEGEWNEDGTSYVLSLAGQVFTPMMIDVNVLDENDWTVLHLKPQQSYRLRIRIHGENPDPNWKATVSIKGETYLLDINNTEQEVEFVTPPNNTNVGFNLDLEYELHTDFEYNYSNGNSIPSFTVMPLDLSESISATINSGNALDIRNYPFEVNFNFNYQTLESYYSFKSPEYFFRYGNVFISLGPVFAGCRLGFPYEDVVLDSQGSASLDLNKLPKYQTTWYTDGWSTPFIQVYRSENVLAATVQFRTNLEMVKFYLKGTDGVYRSIDDGWYHTVNKPYPTTYIGHFDSKVKKIQVRLVTNPLPTGANFLPTPLELDVVGGYASFNPPTPTVAYDSAISPGSWTYYVTRVVIKILEADDPVLVGRMTQIKEFKVVISNG